MPPQNVGAHRGSLRMETIRSMKESGNSVNQNYMFDLPIDPPCEMFYICPDCLGENNWVMITCEWCNSSNDYSELD